MTKDLKVTTGVAAALLLAGCGREDGTMRADRDTAVCTDSRGRRVADSNCGSRTGSHGGAYAWYFLGRNSALPYMGERATGGSYQRTAGTSYFRAASTTARALRRRVARWLRLVGARLRRWSFVIRETIAPRSDWRAKVEAEGLVWHSAEGRPYWDESVYYSFTGEQIAEIEAATAELYRLLLVAGQAIVDDLAMMTSLGVPAAFHQAIRSSWEAEPPALNYGRFDLGYDGFSPPKLFEFNCDTPTALLEAAIVQWSWKEEVLPHFDQFNSLHDKVVAKWRDIASFLPPGVLFAHVADDAGEDTVTASYLRDTAEAAGIETAGIVIDDLGWDAEARRFVDLNGQTVDAIFKLYPWEWLVNEEFAEPLLESLPQTTWIEPIWKMLWSNKGILAVLWRLFPNHPNLLPASLEIPDGDTVAKPLLSREGANVSIRKAGEVIVSTDGDYGQEGYVYQALYRLPEPAPGCHPVIGSWIVDGEPAGMGIREGDLITGDTARFVPHVIREAV